MMEMSKTSIHVVDHQMKESSFRTVPAELLPLVLVLLLLLGIIDDLVEVVLLLLAHWPAVDPLRGLLQRELRQLLVVDLG